MPVNHLPTCLRCKAGVTVNLVRAIFCPAGPNPLVKLVQRAIFTSRFGPPGPNILADLVLLRGFGPGEFYSFSEVIQTLNGGYTQQ